MGWWIVGTIFCLHCIFLCPNYKDTISNETCTRMFFFFFSSHIHLLIHADCISICFPPITSITQSQSLSQRIFHLSLSSLSSINLNIPTPTGPQSSGSRQTQQWRRKRACSLMCAVSLFSVCVSPRLSAAISTAGVRETDPSSTVLALVCPCPRGVWENESQWRFV